MKPGRGVSPGAEGMLGGTSLTLTQTHYLRTRLPYLLAQIYNQERKTMCSWLREVCLEPRCVQARL